MTRTAVAIGSNLGDRRRHLATGLAGLSELGTVVAVSPLYETAPVGGPDQGAYLNAVVLLDTDLGPAELLRALHGVEAAAGRVREVRWGPRTLDLDLILYGERVIDTEQLTVPHPRFHERRFVLEPLLAVWPDAVDPLGRDLLAELRMVADQDLDLMEGPGWARLEPRANGSGSRGGVWVATQAVLLGALGATSITYRHQISAVGGLVPALGGALLIAGAALGAGGAVSLGRDLTPFPEPLEGARLVTCGAYRLVRHPLYGAVSLGAVGFALALRSWVGLGLALVTAAFFSVKARFEERRLERIYPDYGAYRRSTPRRMIPWLW